MLSRRHMGMIALAAIPLAAVLPLPDFWIAQLNYIGLYGITCLGLVLLTGVGGLTSFGQAAFVGIGAYTTAWLTVNTGMSPWLTLWIGLAITGASALVLAFVTLRMSGHYLPLATIAWGLSLYYLMSNIDALGKYDGILGIRSLSVFGYDIGQGRAFFLLTWFLVAVFAVALLHLLDSRPGRAIRSLKSGSQMAEAMGISTFRYKVTIFVIAALFASVSGWLVAHFQRTVTPTAFGLKMGIEYLFMTVVGGVAHVWGALAGAALTKLLDDQLQVLLPRLIGTSGSYEVIVFGIALVMMLKYQPDGLWDFVERRLPAQAATGRLDQRAAAGREQQAGAWRAGAGREQRAQGVRRAGRREGRGLPDPGRRDRRADRPERRRQDHHLQPDHRRAPAHRRRRALPRTACQRTARAPDRARWAWPAPFSTSR